LSKRNINLKDVDNTSGKTVVHSIDLATTACCCKHTLLTDGQRHLESNMRACTSTPNSTVPSNTDIQAAQNVCATRDRIGVAHLVVRVTTNPQLLAACMQRHAPGTPWLLLLQPCHAANNRHYLLKREARDQKHTQASAHTGISQPALTGHGLVTANTDRTKHLCHTRQVWCVATHPPAACNNQVRKASFLQCLPVCACQRSWADCRSERQWQLHSA
jgi:hypothetical protein